MREGRLRAPGIGHRAREQCASGARGHRVGVGARLRRGPRARQRFRESLRRTRMRTGTLDGGDTWLPGRGATRGLLGGEGREGAATVPLAGERGMWEPEQDVDSRTKRLRGFLEPINSGSEKSE